MSLSLEDADGRLNKNLAWKIWGQMQKDAEGPIKQSLMNAAYDQG
jgi:hypothetical protein